jgi:CheY-like chemotaxis protein
MKHLLIIEDEEGILQFLIQGLEEENYQISTATNGLDGLTLFQNEKFDLVLLDWMLPEITGLDVCKNIMVIMQEGFQNDKYAPSSLLVQLVTEGKLGVKTGQGFYQY